MDTETQGLWMLAALGLSPLVLLGLALLFRRACLPPGEGSWLSAAAAWLLGGGCGLVIMAWLSHQGPRPLLPDPLNASLYGPVREELLKATAMVLLVLARRVPDGWARSPARASARWRTTST